MDYQANYLLACTIDTLLMQSCIRYATAKSGDVVHYDLHIIALESRSTRTLPF
jgi:hypothetical protein